MTNNFFTKLEKRITDANTLLCIGLDPHPEDLATDTADQAKEYCLNLIKQTQEFAAAYKPNIAFFERFGADGISALQKVVSSIPAEIPVLLDAKRGDISSTAQAYAETVFETLKVDAVTLSPYLGRDSIAPFIDNPEQAAFVLCKTSNAGSADLQDQYLQSGEMLYENVAKLAQSWNQHNNLGIVVGATHPEALKKVRVVAPDLWILAPGIGAQGGNLQEALMAGCRKDGSGILVPVSRGISRSENPAGAAKNLRDEINEVRKNISPLMHTPKIDLAISLYDQGCVKFGSFTLKSGLISPIYIDLRRLASLPALLTKVGKAFSKLMSKLEFDHLAALPYAAMPIGTAISIQNNWSMIYPRKESKEYGTKVAIEGIFSSGDKVVVVDDLTTTGGSKFEAFTKLEDAGLVVEDVVVLIDRQSGAKESLADNGYKLHTIFSLEELARLLLDANKISDSQFAEVERFINQS